eukprot:6713731-Lingulodinium_polyedra.AAC.1
MVPADAAGATGAAAGLCQAAGRKAKGHRKARQAWSQGRGRGPCRRAMHKAANCVPLPSMREYTGAV